MTEENIGFEIADSVARSTIDLGEVFEHMDQSDNAIDTDDASFSLFSLPELDVGIGMVCLPQFLVLQLMGKSL